MLILGLNAYHGDSSACLLRDGQLVAAVEEERFRRIKHWAGLPTESIAYCLSEASARLSDVDYIAVNRNQKANNLRRMGYVLKNRPDSKLILNRLRNIRKAASIEDAIASAFPNERVRAQVRHIEHHFAHLASAFFTSRFDQAVCISVDGFGDFASAAWGVGRGSGMAIDGRVYFPHSLGVFYEAMTQFIGFPHYGDEYKVMGLAPYGEPRYMDAMREIVRVKPDGTFELNLKYFRHHTENTAYNWNDCAPQVDAQFSVELEQLLGPARGKGEPLEQRHRDIARSTQVMYEEAFFALLNAKHEKYGIPNLALAGGCAMNSVANGKVYSRTPFRKMYLPAAAGDAGGAIGAACAVWHSLDKTNGRFPMDHAYWGPNGVGIEQLLAAKATEIAEQNCKVRLIEESRVLCEATARAISEGKVIGWFEGRMEWGPRALGNRSILGDPRRADMKDILNSKIKRRESFRPFAPSILREAVPDWFEIDDDVPFMMQVFPIRPDKRSQIPAVTHVDGSGRLQTVHRETNPLYHELIREFQDLTGVPIVLNTSFNENEPVVCRPEEALDCFLRTKMDVLVLGKHYIERTRSHS
jgi:carbamoyltransferase